MSRASKICGRKKATRGSPPPPPPHHPLAAIVRSLAQVSEQGRFTYITHRHQLFPRRFAQRLSLTSIAVVSDWPSRRLTGISSGPRADRPKSCDFRCSHSLSIKLNYSQACMADPCLGSIGYRACSYRDPIHIVSLSSSLRRQAVRQSNSQFHLFLSRPPCTEYCS